jgi:hypothetical protein
MVCGKCKHEFCWLCLDSYYSYLHGDNNRACPFRQTALVVTFILLVVMLNQKCFYYVGWYNSLVWFLLWTVGATLMIDLVLMSAFFYLPLGEGIYKNLQ